MERCEFCGKFVWFWQQLRWPIRAKNVHVRCGHKSAIVRAIYDIMGR